MQDAGLRIYFVRRSEGTNLLPIYINVVGANS